MAVDNNQHLKHTEVPAWVVNRLRQYVDAKGGKKLFMSTFSISEAYMSLLWNGKRHPPKELHEALGIKLVVTPIHYEDLKGDAA
jgi:hypothetical protein